MDDEKLNDHVREILQQNILLKEINDSLNKKLTTYEKTVRDIETHRLNHDRQESILLEEIYTHYSKLYKKMQETTTSLKNHIEKIQQMTKIDENANNMSITTDMEGVILDCNNEFLNNMQLEKKDILKNQIQDFVKIDKSWKEFLTENEQIQAQLQCKNVTKTIAMKNIKIEKESVVFALRDITETLEKNKDLKNIGQTLQKQFDILVLAEQKKDQFFSHFSHELKTPLVPIIGFAEMLEKNKINLNSKEGKEKVHIIRKNAKILNDYITKIIDVHKVSLDKLYLRKTTQDIFETVEDTIKEARYIMEEKNITVDNKTQNTILEYDDMRISQVLRYIIDNSTKFSQDNTTITITSVEEPSEIILSVEDEGIGIDKEYRKRVFEKFFQVNSEFRTNLGGMGLGLTICMGIIEAHGGKIWVDDAAKGCKMSFSLPATDTDDK